MVIFSWSWPLLDLGCRALYKDIQKYYSTPKYLNFFLLNVEIMAKSYLCQITYRNDQYEQFA